MNTTKAAAILMLLCAGVVYPSRASAGPMYFFTGQPNGAATKDNPFILQLDDGSGKLTTVKVSGIDATMTPSEKAEKIRDAIPAKFRPRGINNEVKVNAAKVIIKADPTKEKFDKLGAGVKSVAAMSLGGTSTGLDPLGKASSIQVGIDNVFVDNISLTSGMSAAMIDSLLASDLNSHGISATATIVSPTNANLVLNNPINPSNLFVFGDSDTGVNITPSITSVPEPATVTLLGTGLLTLAGYGWRRRKRVASEQCHGVLFGCNE